MQTSTKIVGTAGVGLAACAACCAVSVVPALAAGSGLVALGGAVATWSAAALLIAVPIAGVIYMSRRSPSAAKAAPTLNALLSAPADVCGCGTCGTESTKEAPAIACSLDAGDFKVRTAGIRNLANRSLRRASRTPLTLSLTYGPEALAELQDLVRKEEDCCAFLTFDLTHDAAGVYLTITAPEAAAEAADMLFDHFAPDAAKENQLELA